MSTEPIDQLELISTSVLSDDSENEYASLIWDDFDDEESPATYGHESPHRCARCLFAASRANIALGTWSELEAFVANHQEFWMIQSLPRSQYFELTPYSPYAPAPLEQQPTAPVKEEESDTATTEETPATILARNKLFNRTMTGVFYAACGSGLLVILGVLSQSAVTLVIAVGIFLLAFFIWLACFTWIAWVVIRVTMQRGWSWLKPSNKQANHPNH